MSRELFSLNPDLAQLRAEGYFMRIQGNLLVMREVPYVNAQREVRFGTLSSPVGADANLSHRADPILSQGWKPTLRGSAVDKFRV